MTARRGNKPKPRTNKPRPDGALVVATDGSCLRNPGPGGWCWYVDDACWAAGGELETTNNRMELEAVASLLERTDKATPLVILADSRYVIDICESWRHGWRRRGWKTADGSPVKNRDLVERIDALLTGRTVVFEHVYGHTGHALNERADTIARAAATAIATKRAPITGPVVS